MKLCIPVTESNGLKSQVSAHFGSAPFFVIADSDNNSHSVVENSRSAHAHGQCGQFPAVSENNVSAVICNGMGRRALANLNASQVKAYTPKTICTTASDAIEAFKSGNCTELLPESACTHGHSEDGEGHGCHD